MSLETALLEVKDLKKSYLVKRPFRKPGEVQALRGIQFALKPFETLAIVGESGCGKSTLAKVAMKLEDFMAGEVLYEGRPLSQIDRVELTHIVQMVFQDPNSSLNPRKKVLQSIMEPLLVKGITKAQAQEQATAVATQVGLSHEMLGRFPHMLSGGQKQRVGIARALVTRPKIIICDEPVSALDVSVQAQVINLLLDLQEKFKLSYLFISHDLNVVRFIAHRIAVLYLGKIVELGTKEQIFTSPRHPYTRLLLTSGELKIPNAKPVEYIEGEIPSPLNPPKACAFHSRCPWAIDRCRTTEPLLQASKSFQNNKVACHRAEEGLW